MSENSQSMRPAASPAVTTAAQAARFPDLRSAGRHLAAALKELKGRADVIVLGLALGGLPVAFEVAQQLSLPLDFVILRRLLASQDGTAPLCAANVAGTLVLDEELPLRPVTPQSGFDYFIADALLGLAHRTHLCRGGRPSIELTQKTILLVDCGIRTGSTLQAAIRAVRSQQPAQIIAAVPVAAPEGRTAIELIADQMVCLASPEPFGHVGLWYQDFSRPDDHQVSELLG
jgi:putative phosphoribosyl transferase